MRSLRSASAKSVSSGSSAYSAWYTKVHARRRRRGKKTKSSTHLSSRSEAGDDHSEAAATAVSRLSPDTIEDPFSSSSSHHQQQQQGQQHEYSGLINIRIDEINSDEEEEEEDDDRFDCTPTALAHLSPLASKYLSSKSMSAGNLDEVRRLTAI